ncbi:hypothetical protein LZ32DRAFT_610334 [Colletotrichum eremochloae]|nr:hypothetical protein LZ32DRAFT_610334 [Colletotrichum eremochloae]
MTELDDISYSREECIAAISDYYSFLTKMYLIEEDVVQPPECGWPSITSENMARLGKTDEVISLLRHLPYIRKPYSWDNPQGAAYCYFADWPRMAQGKMTGDELRLVSESPELYENVPPHVISITSGGRDNPVFLLDTELGIVYWWGCPGEIRKQPIREEVSDDPYDWAPENEADWRSDAARWAVKDFFEILKNEFITLSFIPINSRIVLDIYAKRYPPCEGWKERVQAIYSHHGWPSLENFRKDECLKAIKAALTEEFPEFWGL